MTEERTKYALSVIIVGDPGQQVPGGLCSGAAEVIEVGETPVAGLASTLDPGARHRFLRSSQRVTGRVNLGLSFASCPWIAVVFGDEGLSPGWLECVRYELKTPVDADAHLFAPADGSGPPLVVLRRRALAHGAPDERFPADRLCLLHWAAQIAEPAGGKIMHHVCDRLSGGWPAVPAPLAAAVELWKVLDAPARAELLRQAAADPQALAAELAGLAERERRIATATAVYRGCGYDPRRFWEENTADYVKWEVYQPDELEIEKIVSRARPSSVLELGCGAGRNARYFEGALRYVGIDLSANLLSRAIERQCANAVGVVRGDVRMLPFRDAGFDMVFADSTLQHVPPDGIAACVAEAMRVSARHVCVIEYTRERDGGGSWFEQAHMFAHDYPALFFPGARLVWRAETSQSVQPAVKEAFLFEKAA